MFDWLTYNAQQVAKSEDKRRLQKLSVERRIKEIKDINNKIENIIGEFDFNSDLTSSEVLRVFGWSEMVADNAITKPHYKWSWKENKAVRVKG